MHTSLKSGKESPIEAVGYNTWHEAGEKVFSWTNTYSFFEWLAEKVNKKITKHALTLFVIVQ